MGSLGRTSMLSRQLNGPRPPLTDEERQELLQQRRQIDECLARNDASVPRYTGSGSSDLAAAMTKGNNMTSVACQRKRTHDAANTVPNMSRLVSSGIQSTAGQRVYRTRHLSIGQHSSPSMPSPSPISYVPSTEPSWSRSTDHMMSMPQRSYNDRHVIYTPADYIGQLQYDDLTFKRPRQGALSTPSVTSLATSFTSGRDSSFASSYLTTPSSAASPLLCASSFQDSQWLSNNSQQGVSMSRQPSMASSIGLSRPFQQMMGVAESTLPMAEPIFRFDDLSQQDSISPFAAVNADAFNGNVLKQACSSVAAEGAGLYTFEDDNDLSTSASHANGTFAQPIELCDQVSNGARVNDHAASATEAASVAMQRTSSSGSTSSTTSRDSERRQRQVENGKRQPIKSKDALDMTSGVDKDAKPKNGKQAISKLPYRRPKHPKLKCTHCKEHPRGFHGAHELRRHVERAHATTQKTVWICQQPPGVEPPRQPLDSCKACKEGRQYNVYYNAAAHIRRAHFFPKLRGRCPKGEKRESRAGKAGGDNPKISWLKHHGWIKSINVIVQQGIEHQGTTHESMYDEESDDNACLDQKQSMTGNILSGGLQQQHTWPPNIDGGTLDGPDAMPEWDDTTSQQNFIGAGMTLPARVTGDEPFDVDEFILSNSLAFASPM